LAILFYCIRRFVEQTNSEKDTLQNSLDALREERSIEAEKLRDELKQQLRAAAEQHETKLQAEINKGTRL